MMDKKQNDRDAEETEHSCEELVPSVGNTNETGQVWFNIAQGTNSPVESYIDDHSQVWFDFEQGTNSAMENHIAMRGKVSTGRPDPFFPICHQLLSTKPPPMGISRRSLLSQSFHRHLPARLRLVRLS